MRWIGLLLALVIMQACGSSPTASASLHEGEWILIELNDSPIDLPDSLRPMLEFASTRDQFTGYGGCNKLFGAIKITGEVWTFKEIGATKMACDRLVLEQDFISALGKSNRYRQEGEKLYLLRDEVELAVLKNLNNDE